MHDTTQHIKPEKIINMIVFASVSAETFKTMDTDKDGFMTLNFHQVWPHTGTEMQPYTQTISLLFVLVSDQPFLCIKCLCMIYNWHPLIDMLSVFYSGLL